MKQISKIQKLRDNHSLAGARKKVTFWIRTSSIFGFDSSKSEEYSASRLEISVLSCAARSKSCFSTLSLSSSFSSCSRTRIPATWNRHAQIINMLFYTIILAKWNLVFITLKMYRYWGSDLDISCSKRDKKTKKTNL